MEYVVPLSGRFGQRYQYRLTYEPEQHAENGRFLTGIKSVEQLRKEANLAGVLGNLAPQNGHLAPTSQVAKREVQKRGTPRQSNGLLTSPPNLAPFSRGRMPKTQINGVRP
jgi:hypothetical protein